MHEAARIAFRLGARQRIGDRATEQRARGSRRAGIESQPARGSLAFEPQPLDRAIGGHPQRGRQPPRSLSRKPGRLRLDGSGCQAHVAHAHSVDGIHGQCPAERRRTPAGGADGQGGDDCKRGAAHDVSIGCSAASLARARTGSEERARNPANAAPASLSRVSPDRRTPWKKSSSS